jgi:hypothetical protein
LYNHLKCSLCLINTSTNSQVVDGRMLNNSFLVNNEQSSQCNSLHHWICYGTLWHKSKIVDSGMKGNSLHSREHWNMCVKDKSWERKIKIWFDWIGYQSETLQRREHSSLTHGIPLLSSFGERWYNRETRWLCCIVIQSYISNTIFLCQNIPDQEWERHKISIWIWWHQKPEDNSSHQGHLTFYLFEPMQDARTTQQKQ